MVPQMEMLPPQERDHLQGLGKVVALSEKLVEKQEFWPDTFLERPL